MRQDDFEELCRRLLNGEPRKPDYSLVWTLICYGVIVVMATCYLVWARPLWPF